MFPPCGKWSITSSIISDRGSCFKPVHSDWFASASGAGKRGTQRNSFWVHAHIDKHTGCGNLPILFCFLSAYPCKTAVHFEQEVRMLEWLSNTIVLNMATSKEMLNILFQSTDHIQSVVLSVAVWLRLTCLSHPDRGSWGWAGGWLTTNVTLPVPCYPRPQYLPSTSNTILLWNDNKP